MAYTEHMDFPSPSILGFNGNVAELAQDAFDGEMFKAETVEEIVEFTERMHGLFDQMLEFVAEISEKEGMDPYTLTSTELVDMTWGQTKKDHSRLMRGLERKVNNENDHHGYEWTEEKVQCIAERIFKVRALAAVLLYYFHTSISRRLPELAAVQLDTFIICNTDIPQEPEFIVQIKDMPEPEFVKA